MERNAAYDKLSGAEKASIMMLALSPEHAAKLFALLDKLKHVEFVKPQILREYRICQTSCGLRNEPAMGCDRLKVRLDLAPEVRGLPAEFEVVVENLPLFVD